MICEKFERAHGGTLEGTINAVMNVVKREGKTASAFSFNYLSFLLLK